MMRKEASKCTGLLPWGRRPTQISIPQTHESLQSTFSVLSLMGQVTYPPQQTPPQGLPSPTRSFCVPSPRHALGSPREQPGECFQPPAISGARPQPTQPSTANGFWGSLVAAAWWGAGGQVAAPEERHQVGRGSSCCHSEGTKHCEAQRGSLFAG